MRAIGNLAAFVWEFAKEFLPGRRFRQEFGPMMAPSVRSILAARLVKQVRFCPHCGAGSPIPEEQWLRIEVNDEEITCMGCFRVPRLWLREAVQ
ncbi:hypothetical protein AB0383_20085 [Amycolatopsis sp. NPDC051373]|uniref:hypothetical protein n=1 Tax=Amycolatopsis sp. NPDC051373 TaxID=3155801 RepID=UPI00344F6406